MEQEKAILGGPFVMIEEQQITKRRTPHKEGVDFSEDFGWELDNPTLFPEEETTTVEASRRPFNNEELRSVIESVEKVLEFEESSRAIFDPDEAAIYVRKRAISDRLSAMSLPVIVVELIGVTLTAEGTPGYGIGAMVLGALVAGGSYFSGRRNGATRAAEARKHVETAIEESAQQQTKLLTIKAAAAAQLASTTDLG